MVTGSTDVAVSGDTFTYDPRLADGTLIGLVGDATVRYRLVHLDAGGTPLNVGDWVNFAFSLEAPPAGGFEIQNLDLVNDDGDSDSDNATTDPTTSGKVVYAGSNYLNPPDPAHAVVQYDLDGDDRIDGTVIADADGIFEFRPHGLSYGQHTVRVRALEWDISYGTYLLGPWAQHTVHLIPAPSPAIDNFRLMADTGLSDTDLITANPSVSGQVALEDSGIAGSQVHFDWDGDGVTDATTFTDSEGYFTFRPRGLTPGPVTIAAKSLYWDEMIQAHVYSPETSLTFTYDPPAIPSLDWMDLAVDDGDVSLDRITTNPTLMGQLQTTSLRASIYLEFDHDGDGTPDGYSSSDSFGSFVYAPVGLTPGANTVGARTKQWDNDTGDWRYSDWTNLAFTLEAVAAPTLEVDSLSLRRDTGADDSDLVTSEPTLVGAVAGTTTLGRQLIDIDTDGDGTRDGQAITDAEGNFSYVPVGLAAGAHTIQARTRFWDTVNSVGVTGTWQSLSFTLADEANQPPQVTSLGLYSDSGTSDSDQQTENPLLVGYVSNPDGSTQLLIEVDQDSDGAVDAYTYADADGRFFALPDTSTYGSVSVQVRAKEYDAAGGTVLTSAWHSFSFTYEDQVDAAPILASVAWQSEDADHERPVLSGTVLDDHSVSAVGIEIDHDGDNVADVVVATDWFGRFQYEPTSAAYGSVTYSIRTKETDNDGTSRTGPWQSHTFTNVAPAANVAPSITDYTLVHDTGVSGSDAITSNLRLAGQVLNDGETAGLLVQFDSDNNGVPDGSTLTDAEGRFEFTPRGLALGAHTIQVRVKEFTLEDGAVYGGWLPITVTYEASRHSHIASLTLANDTGTNTSDGATSDPALTGSVGGDLVGNVLIFFDHNRDGVPDGNTTSNASGGFTYTPAELEDGVRRIRAWVARGGSPGDASGNSVRFVLATDPDDAETQAKVAELAAQDAAWQTAQGNFDTAIAAANTTAKAAYNAADTTYDTAINTATTTYQTALDGADAAYASAVEAAEEAYATALDTARTQFETDLTSFSDPATTDIPVFVWPAAPPSDSLVIPDDGSQPQVPYFLGIDDEAYDVDEEDAGLVSTVQTALATAQQNQQTTDGTFQATVAAANTAEADAQQAAHNAYAATVAAARQTQSATANQTQHPTIDLAAAALAYANAVQAAHDVYNTAYATAETTYNTQVDYWTNYWWDDGWSPGAEPWTWDQWRQFNEWDGMRVFYTDRDRANGLIDAEVVFETAVATAQHTLQIATASAYRTLQDAQAQYDHWKQQNAIAARATFETERALAIETRQKENADAQYTKQVAAIHAAFAAAQSAFNSSQSASSTVSGAVASHAAALSAFRGTPAAASAATSAQKDADLETIMAPRRAAHALLEAETQRDSALRLALEAKNAAYAHSEATREARVKEVNAEKVLFDTANDAWRDKRIKDHEAGETQKVDDSLAVKTHRIDTVEAEQTRTHSYWTTTLPYAAEGARLDGIRLADSQVGNPPDYATAVAFQNNTYVGFKAALPIETTRTKALADIDKTKTHALADHKNTLDKALNLALQEYRDQVAEAIDVYDTDVIEAGATESKKSAQANGGYLSAAATEEQTVAGILVPSATNLANLESTTIRDILVAKAQDRHADEVASANAQAAHTSAWNTSTGTPWSDYQNDKAQAEKNKQLSLSQADLDLLTNSAGSTLTLATTVHTLSSTLTLDEVAAWVGHATGVVGALTTHATSAAQTTTTTGDLITDKTETFDKGLNQADKVRSDSLSDNQRDIDKSYATAEAQYLYDEADVDEIYWNADHDAHLAYALATVDFNFGLIDSTALATAAQTRGTALNTASATRTTGHDAAGVTRRTTEGQAIKTKTVNDAVAQKN